MTDTCVHRPYLYDDANDVEHYGDPCGRTATHVSCQPHVGALTCNEHKCRCAYAIGETPVYNILNLHRVTMSGETARTHARMKGATNIGHPKYDSEYGRRNLLHCKAVGAHANARIAWLRLRRQKRAPKWLVTYLAGIVDRTKPVADEMAAHRDEVW